MDAAAGAIGKLFGHIAALQPRQQVKAVFAQHAGNRLNAHIYAAAQIGHIADIMLVRIHQRAVQPRLFQLGDQRLLTAMKFLALHAQLFVKFGSTLQYFLNLLSLLHPCFHVSTPS